MLWVGVVTTLVGGFAAIAASAKERTERTHASQGNHSEAQKPDKEDVSEKQQVRSRYPRKDTFRYELVFRFWLIGALCIAISALVSILGG